MTSTRSPLPTLLVALLLTACSGTDPGASQSSPVQLADRSQLKQLERPGSELVVFMAGGAAVGDHEQGWFAWRGGDRSHQVGNNPAETIWIPPNEDPSGLSGAWERLSTDTRFTNRVVNIPSDYPTLQHALDAESRWGVAQGVTVTLNIESGHRPDTGLSVSDGDYSHIRITSDDAKVIVGDGFDSTFLQVHNARAPVLDALIDQNGQGDLGARYVASTGKVEAGAGVKNTGSTPLWVHNSTVHADDTIWTGGGHGAAVVVRGSVLTAFRADFSDVEATGIFTGFASLFVAQGSVFSGQEIKLNNSAGSAVTAHSNSTVDLGAAQILNADRVGVRADRLSTIHLSSIVGAEQETEITGAERGIMALEGARIYLQGGSVTGSGERDLWVETGGAIYANGVETTSGRRGPAIEDTNLDDFNLPTSTGVIWSTDH